MKGAYVLIVLLDEDKEITVGKLGKHYFPKGYYTYVGSGMKNLEKRIERHLRRKKKLRWHIDYLLKHGKVVDVIKFKSEKKIECSIARKISEIGRIVVENFGSTDCKCRTHLFYFPYNPKPKVYTLM